MEAKGEREGGMNWEIEVFPSMYKIGNYENLCIAQGTLSDRCSVVT